MKCIYACSSFHDYLSRCVGIVAKFPKWSKIATLCVTLCYLSIHRHTTISSRVSGIMGGGVAWGHSQTHYYILTCERYYGWRGCLETRYLKLLVIACNILCNRYMVYNSSEQVDSTMTPNLCITKYILLMRVYAIHVVQFIY